MGSIPACAGEPCADLRPESDDAVYPRVCGGTQRLIDVVDAGRGLSPRVRGNPQRAELDLRQRRSIPACAGEPISPHFLEHVTGVYPRVCGGTTEQQRLTERHHGLSPRVRGNPGGELVIALRPGVYPRVCGGTALTRVPSGRRRGLSPRVRGNLHRGILSVPTGRSIPACAGEPQHRGQQHHVQRVYPRVCGGTQLAARLAINGLGLSPRVRGNRLYPEP